MQAQPRLQGLPGLSWGATSVAWRLSQQEAWAAAWGQLTPSPSVHTRFPEAAILITPFPGDAFIPPRRREWATRWHSRARCGEPVGGDAKTIFNFPCSAQFARQTWRQPGNGFRPGRPRRSLLAGPWPWRAAASRALPSSALWSLHCCLLPCLVGAAPPGGVGRTVEDGALGREGKVSTPPCVSRIVAGQLWGPEER